MSQSWIPDETWHQTPRPDATHYTVVHDPDLGTLAEATRPDGTTTYGTDPGPGGGTQARYRDFRAPRTK